MNKITPNLDQQGAQGSSPGKDQTVQGSLAGAPGAFRRMGSNLPAAKVTAATLAAAVVQILVALNERTGGPEISAEVIGAITVLLTVAVGYLTPPGKNEQIIEFIDPIKAPDALKQSTA